MPTLNINPPYPIFTERDGKPLEAGYIYVGVANLDPQTNPINVFWDKNQTQLAAQPIRTSGGYPLNNGSPARLYADTDYSIRVYDRQGTVVYHSPFVTDRISSAVFSTSGITTADIADGAITNPKLATNAVTEVKIASNAVTYAKLSSGAPFWDINSNVGIGTGSPATRLDVQGGTLNSIARFGPANTTSDFQGIIIQNGRDSSLIETNSYIESRNNLGTPDGGISFNHGTNGGAGTFIWATPTGSRTTDRRYVAWGIDPDGRQTSVVNGFPTGTRYPQFGCRAWVNFQGTGTVTIRDARNVSSVADTGLGDYQINFSQAMPTNQYATIGTSGADNRLTTYAATVFIEEQQTGAVMIYTGTHGASSPATYVDMQIICVAIFL